MKKTYMKPSINYIGNAAQLTHGSGEGGVEVHYDPDTGKYVEMPVQINN